MSTRPIHVQLQCESPVQAAGLLMTAEKVSSLVKKSPRPGKTK
jgi:hypothetical protein